MTEIDSSNLPYFGQAYRIKLLITLEKTGKFWRQNELYMPGIYFSLQDARSQIEADIHHRLHHSLYFRSQRAAFDLVLYGEEASLNTYLAYRIVRTRRLVKKLAVSLDKEKN